MYYFCICIENYKENTNFRYIAGTPASRVCIFFVFVSKIIRKIQNSDTDLATQNGPSKTLENTRKIGRELQGVHARGVRPRANNSRSTRRLVHGIIRPIGTGPGWCLPQTNPPGHPTEGIFPECIYISDSRRHTW